jgi:hypothetical protein
MLYSSSLSTYLLKFNHASEFWSVSPPTINSCRYEAADTCRVVQERVIKNRNLGLRWTCAWQSQNQNQEGMGLA